MKRLLHRRWFLVLAIVVVVLIPTAWLVAHNRTPADDSVITHVKRGGFAVTVTNAGELRAPKFVEITVPSNANEAEQYQMKIQSLVPEGTIVKTGDVVAELDRSTIASKLSDVTLALQKADAVYEQASLDSTLDLSKAREDMHAASLTLETKKLAQEQSQYEAPSVKRQAEIDYEMASRALHQDSTDLVTKTEQAQAKMREVGSDLEQQKNKLKVVQDVMAQFTIKAPAPGMVIYVKEWNGKERGVGSQVSSWDPDVATLPDLSKMESVTYVNEVDIRKVAVGQPVAVTLDADPNKVLRGTVTKVANAGEQRPNSDAKVFEVDVNIEHPDTTLRPGMTTGNAIQTYAAANVLHIPLEALMNDQGIPYVYHRDGSHIVKQEVETGAVNDDEVIIARGLHVGDEVLLSNPPDHDKMVIARLANSRAHVTANGDTGLGTQPMPPQPDSAARATASSHP